MSNQNAGYRSQSPSVSLAANLHSLKSNTRFHAERGELPDDALHELHIAAQILDVAVRMIQIAEKHS